MDDIYFLVDLKVPILTRAGVYHNRTILRKYCCPGSNRYRKRGKYLKKKYCLKNSKSLHLAKNTSESNCSLLSEWVIKTCLFLTSVLLDAMLFHFDNIIEFSFEIIKIFLMWAFWNIQSSIAASKNYLIKVLFWFVLEEFNYWRCSRGVGIHNRFINLGGKILFSGLVPCYAVSYFCSPGEINVCIYFSVDWLT